jgi:CRP-like cAMP-binding protein
MLFGDSHSYPLNIYSVTACELLHITRAAVSEFLRHYSFVMQYVRSLSANSQGMNRKITMLTQKTLRENIRDYLKEQSLRQNTSRIVLPISKKELADHLGVQRPSLFRELKKMKDEGMIRIDRRSVTILF